MEGNENSAQSRCEEEIVAAKRPRTQEEPGMDGDCDIAYDNIAVNVDQSSGSLYAAECNSTGDADNTEGSILNDSCNTFEQLNTSCSAAYSNQFRGNNDEQCDDAQRELKELRKAYAELRNKLTEAECDKLDLEKSVTEANISLQSSEQCKEMVEEEASAVKDELREMKDLVASLQTKLAEVEANRLELLNELEKLGPCLLTLEELKADEDKLKFYTGLPSYAVFDHVVNHVSSYVVHGENSKLAPWQCILLCLMRLRLTLTLQDLAYRFNISVATACRVFEKWLYAMYICLDSLIFWPDRETLYKTMPNEFKEAFGKNVAVIINCSEVFIDKPTALDTRAQIWSNYKHQNRVKFVIGITPCGSISFISDAWGGRVRDKHIAIELACLINFYLKIL